MGGAALAAATFAATPFLLPDLSARLDVPIGLTGLLSTAQVGSFALATFFAGRFFRPRRRYHYGALVLVSLASFAGAVVTNLILLSATRVVAGIGMGALTWIAWADATRFQRGLGEVAAVGPVTAMAASPVLGWLVGQGGFPLVYATLGVLALAVAFLPVDFGDLPRVGRRVSGSRSNRVLLIALLLLTMGGSAVFIFSGAIASGLLGLSPLALSWALSLNALTGVVATRFDAGRGTAGLWLTGTALAALVLGTISSSVVFFLALAVWGFAFWMGVPAVFRLLVERSLVPNERMGDAQALMALGRVFGPAVGGAALGDGQYDRLAATGAVIMGASAGLIGGVEVARKKRGYQDIPPS